MTALELAAFGPHQSATTDRAWDGPANETKVRTGEDDAYYRRVYAWADPDGEKGTKAAYRFIHHHVTDQPGAANVRACITGIAVLNGARGGTTIPDGDRQGVYRHLAGHLRAAGVDPPELRAAADADQYTGVILTVELDGDDWTVDADGNWELARRNRKTGEDGEDGEDGEEDPDDEDGEEDPDDAPADSDDDEDDEEDEGDGKKKKMPPWLKKKIKSAEDTVVAAAGDGPNLIAWAGVLCVEGRPTGDGRQFDTGSLWWDDTRMPQDLFAMLRDPDGGSGHDGAEICGRIDRIWREPHPDDPTMNVIRGEGFYDTALPAGAEVVRLQRQKMLRGVSIDVDSVEVAVQEGADEMDMLKQLLGAGDGLQRFTRGRIRRATVCSIPAFIEASVQPVDAIEDTALVADGTERWPTVWTVWTPWDTGDPATVVASARFGDSSEVFSSPILELPPKAVFARRDFAEYTPVTIDADGIISGYALPWGECHVGFADRCVLVTGSDNAYRYARTGHVLTAEGDLVPTARIYAQFKPGRRGHAPEHLRAADATAWYEEMSQAVADVVIYDDRHGMQLAGRVRPGITRHQLIALRASDLSPDWRAIAGKRECLAIAAVNVSGFPSRYDRIPALVASAVESGQPVDVVAVLAREMGGVGYLADGQLVTLVASATARRGGDVLVRQLAGQVAQLAATVADMREEQLADKARRILAGVEFTVDDGPTDHEHDDNPDDVEDGGDGEFEQDVETPKPDAELSARVEAALAGVTLTECACDGACSCETAGAAKVELAEGTVCANCGTRLPFRDATCPQCSAKARQPKK